MENVIIGLIIVGYGILSLWGYRAAAQQARADAVAARKVHANPGTARKS